MNDGIFKVLESKAHSLRNVSIKLPPPSPQTEHFQENVHLYPEVLLCYCTILIPTIFMSYF
jgi:hypothetical protein